MSNRAAQLQTSDRSSDPKPRIAAPTPNLGSPLRPQASDRRSDPKPRIADRTPNLGSRIGPQTSDRRSDPKPRITDRTLNLGSRIGPQTSDRGSDLKPRIVGRTPNLGSRLQPQTSDRGSDPKPGIADRTLNLGSRIGPQTSDRGSDSNVTQDPDLGLDSDLNPDLRADPDRDRDSDPDPGPYLSSGLRLGTALGPRSLRDADPARPARRGPAHVAAAPGSGSRPGFDREPVPSPMRTRAPAYMDPAAGSRLQAGRHAGPGPQNGCPRGRVPASASAPAPQTPPSALHGGCLEEALAGLAASRAGADHPDPRQETNPSTASRQGSPWFWSVERPRAAIMATWVPVMGSLPLQSPGRLQVPPVPRSHAPHPRPTGHRTPRSTGSEVSGKLPAGSPWHAPYPGGKPAAADDPEIVPAPSLELRGAHWPLQGRARRPRPPSAAHTGLRSGQGPSVGPESPSPGRACARSPLPAIMAASASERSRRARSGGRLSARAAGAGRAGARACRPPPARGPQAESAGAPAARCPFPHAPGARRVCAKPPPPHSAPGPRQTSGRAEAGPALSRRPLGRSSAPIVPRAGAAVPPPARPHPAARRTAGCCKFGPAASARPPGDARELGESRGRAGPDLRGSEWAPPARRAFVFVQDKGPSRRWSRTRRPGPGGPLFGEVRGLSTEKPESGEEERRGPRRRAGPGKWGLAVHFAGAVPEAPGPAKSRGRRRRLAPAASAQEGGRRSESGLGACAAAGAIAQRWLRSGAFLRQGHGHRPVRRGHRRVRGDS
ncbi:basic proline-rich protein-like [Rousettus aegyptiacus]|uniref:basic proline-rich protein-like n=1 Tax=Rousettus aegyptiacus TaxID=9407 RepID=UPI00168CF838|nr:basic proline-rich protein-like [Rousettus aegyptiacus]